MPDLLYPGNAGCAGAVHSAGGSPRECGAEPTMTVHHRYRYPRPHDARLFACDVHAVDEPDPRPARQGRTAGPCMPNVQAWSAPCSCGECGGSSPGALTG